MLVKKYFRLLLLAGLIVGCNELATINELEEVERQAEYALPLFDTRFSMNDVLEDFEDDAVLSVLSDGLLRLQYSGDVLTENSDDVFEAINETLSQTGIVPVTTDRQALPFTIEGQLSLDRMDLKAGTLDWFITNCHDKDITATITFPTVQKDGVPLVINYNVPAKDPAEEDCTLRSSLFLLQTVDLTDYVITPEEDSIYVDYYAIDTDGVELPPSENTGILIQALSFKYAEGYLGQTVHSGDRDTVEIDFFDNWIQGDVFFEDPVITFNIDNSFGIPTRSVFETFNIISLDGSLLPLESEFITDGVDFPYPTLDEVGQTKSESYVFNRDNSNIREVLSFRPVAIDYDVDASTNPDGDQGVRGFVTDSSFYNVSVDVDLPLYGSAVDFGVRDTFDLNISDLEDVDYAEFKLVTENSMPVGIGLQGYFLDAQGTVLDSLFTEGAEPIIKGADVDAQGYPQGTIETVNFIDFPAERYDKIRTADRLAILATFNTTTEGAQTVRIISDQEVQVRLGAILGLSN